MTGVKLEGWVTAEEAVNIDNGVFCDEFLAWIESKGYQFTGSFGVYEYDRND